MANTPMRLSLTDLLENEFVKAAAAAEDAVEEFTADAHTNWQTRYGDNDRVGGPALAESTVKRKGHDRKLEERPEDDLGSLQNSVASFVESGVLDVATLRYSVHGHVFNNHWLHPIHEFGIDAPPSWGEDTDLRRPTQTLMEIELRPTFAPVIRSRIYAILTGAKR